MPSQIAVERRFFDEHPGAVFDEAWHRIDAQIMFHVERWNETLDELRVLFPEHWQEMTADPVQFDPDYNTYAGLDTLNMLHLVTARYADELIGYFVAIVHGHPHSKSSLTAFTDFVFVKKEHRIGLTGYRLIKVARDTLKAKGVQRMYVGSKHLLEIGPILERLGFKPVETVYAQVFHV